MTGHHAKAASRARAAAMTMRKKLRSSDALALLLARMICESAVKRRVALHHAATNPDDLMEAPWEDMMETMARNIREASDRHIHCLRRLSPLSPHALPSACLARRTAIVELCTKLRRHIDCHGTRTTEPQLVASDSPRRALSRRRLLTTLSASATA